LLDHRGSIGAAGAANAGASFARDLALSLRRATGWLPMRIVGDTSVARRKRSAPAKHPVRGAEYATGVCSITVAQSGRLAPPTRVPLSLVTSLFRYAALRGGGSLHHSLLTTHHSPLTIHYSPLTTHHSPTTLIPVVFDDHDHHAEDEGEEDGDDGEYRAVVEAVGLCGVFRHQRAL